MTHQKIILNVAQTTERKKIMANKTSYTYAMFASDVIAILDGDKELTAELTALMRDKASDLLDQQVKKAAYNAAHPKKNAAKGASAETQAKANTIAKVLSVKPMTAAEISAACGVDYTALQVANACKYIEGVKSCKVIRQTVNAKGLKSEKEYTAYFIG